MRLLPAFLLIPVLFFFKGLTPADTGAYQPVHINASDSREIQNNMAVFTAVQNPLYLSDLSFIADENEDDFSSEKKKSNGHRFVSVINSLFAVVPHPAFLKVPSSSSNSIGYTLSEKYILHRVIRI
jgi:hypothetical protein